MTRALQATSIAALVLSISSAASPAAQADRSRQRLIYEIVVTNPGTRLQGWHGTLYDKNGNAMMVEAGETVDTRIGTFVSVACVQAWSMCGVIHADMLTWMKAHDANVILDTKPWIYKLHVLAEGTKSEGWQGELLHGSTNVTADVDPVVTSMGKFVWRERAYLWDRAGWYHESWPQRRV